MPYAVRVFDSTVSGVRRAVLINDQGGPFFWPNVYSELDYSKASPNTVEKLLRTLGMVYDWAASKEIKDLDALLLEGDFISIEQAESLALFLRFNRKHQLHEVRQAKERPLSTKVVRLEQARGGFNHLPQKLGTVSGFEGATRCKWVALYFEFLLQRRLGSIDRRNTDRANVAAHGEMVVRRIRDLAPEQKPSGNDESLEGLTYDEVMFLEFALRPGAEQNPFTEGFHQHRNYLIWRFFLETGMRRHEARSVRVADVNFSIGRVSIRESKTTPRTVPISPRISTCFHRFIREYWSKIAVATRRHGYLFTTAGGVHLSLDAFNLMFEEIRTKLPKLSVVLTPHTLRRTRSDLFNDEMDALPDNERPTPEQMKAIETRLQGWSADSDMPSRYARRSIRSRADRIAERLANKLGGTER